METESSPGLLKSKQVNSKTNITMKGRSNNTSSGKSKAHNSSDMAGTPSFKRKRDNPASCLALQENASSLIGEYGGCPWMARRKKYDLGVVGYVIIIFKFL